MLSEKGLFLCHVALKFTAALYRNESYIIFLKALKNVLAIIIIHF